VKITALKLSIFIFVIGSALMALKTFVLNPATIQFDGEPTGLRIDRSFQSLESADVDCIILGNSRAYRGVNPSKIKSCRAFNLAHDSDSFNQTYFKLKFVLEKPNLKIKAALVTLDYFDFGSIEDRRNEYYRRYFANEYFNDYRSNFDPQDLFEFLKKINSKWNVFANNEFTIPTKNAVRFLYHATIRPPFPDRSFQRTNGQYVTLPLRHGDPLDWINRDKESAMLDVQRGYFLRLIDLARTRGVKLIFFTAPCRPEELNSYHPATLKDRRSQFKSWSAEYGFSYLDYSTAHDFSIHDFADITHLNHIAADRFSALLDIDIAREL
jgi:hypothetical protein